MGGTTFTAAVGTVSDAADVRVDVYAFLATAMTYPHPETVRKCQEAAALLAAGSDLTPGIRRLFARMAALPVRSERTDLLEVEYTRMFVNAYPTTPLPPYESVQRGEGGLWGDSTVDVARMYRSVGLGFTKANGVAPDHASAEFEFAGLLLMGMQGTHDRTSRSPLSEAYVDFFETHLDSWVAAFCARIETEARVEYYREFGRIGAAFMQQEAERVKSERRPATHG